MGSSGAPESQPVAPSVNYHLWQACNMRCRFCFATFQGVRKNVLPAGHLNRSDSLRIVRALAKAGFSKINFAGGEPFLCPWLVDLVAYAKRLGMVTSVVTNGSYFDRSASSDLLGHLDWFVLSVDSLNPATLIKIGRVAARKPMSKRRYLDICARVRTAGVNLKINTVVTSMNFGEDFSDFIRRARPRRWKIMQMLPLEGPDSRRADDLIVSRARFSHFVKKNQKVRRHGVVVVPETSADMVGSYVMVDPAGRFYDNVSGRYKYSEPILKVGVEEAFSQISFSRHRFFARRGWYYFWGRWTLPSTLSWPQVRVLAGNMIESIRTRMSRSVLDDPAWLVARLPIERRASMVGPFLLPEPGGKPLLRYPWPTALTWGVRYTWPPVAREASGVSSRSRSTGWSPKQASWQGGSLERVGKRQGAYLADKLSNVGFEKLRKLRSSSAGVSTKKEPSRAI